MNLIKNQSKYFKILLNILFFSFALIKAVISSMIDMGNIFICGSVNGDLHVLKSYAFYLDPTTDIDKLPKDKMCLAKTYSAHISYINQIDLIYRNKEKNLKEIISTGIYDECIIKWRFIFRLKN